MGGGGGKVPGGGVGGGGVAGGGGDGKPPSPGKRKIGKPKRYIVLTRNSLHYHHKLQIIR